MLRKTILIIFLLALLVPWTFARDKEQVYVLVKPEPEEEEVRSIYSNEDWGIEFDLREGFTFTEGELEDDTFNLSIELDGFPLLGALTGEQLEDELTSGGYWMQMLENDPSLSNLLVYERKSEIAEAPGIQIRLEGGDKEGYFVILSMIFTSGQRGYTLSVFCDAFYFNEVADFFEEISEGLSFIEEGVEDEDEPGEEDVENTDEAIEESPESE